MPPKEPMTNLPHENSRRAKGWHNLQSLGGLVGREPREETPLVGDTSVEFIPANQKDGPESQTKDTSVEKKEQGKEALLDASRGHIEVLTPGKTDTASRETDTSGAREILTEDMKGAQIDVLPSNVRGKEDAGISLDEKRMFETILEEGASNERRGKMPERDPIDVDIETIREKIEKTANSVEEKVQKNEYTEFLGEKLGLQIKDLAVRLHETIRRKNEGGVPEEETKNEINELLKESATLGSGSWVARFTTKEEAKDPETPVIQAPEQVFETLVSQEEKKFSPEVETQFQKDFAMAQEDLKNIVTRVETSEGEKTIRFSDLSEGQQLLLLENLKDFALDNAKEQALKNFTEEEKEKYGNAGFIKKAFLSYAKSYRRAASMAFTEKDILSKPNELDKNMYTEVLQEMLGQASEAPEAEWKDGKLQVNFVSEKDFEDAPGAKEKVKEYNDIITRFVGIPYEWAYSKNEKKQKQYQEAKESYGKVRTELGWLAYEQEEGDGDALSFVASLDKKVQFSQFFTTHPDVEKAFAETKDQKAWWEGVKAIAKEKGTLMALGRTLSTLGAGVAVSVGSGLFAAPLALALAGGFGGGALSGGIIGRYMAGKRAGQEIEDKKKLAEIGILDASNEKEFRAAHEEKEGVEIGIGLADKLEYAAERVLGAETVEEKDQLLKVLADRMHYTEKKMSMDVVSFGEGAEGFRGRYELLSALAKAQTLFGMSEPETNEKVEKKIDELLGAQEERITTAEEKLKSEKMRQGMKYGIILGGTFGTLLSSLSYAHVHGGTPADAQPATTPAPNADQILLETVAPRASAIPKDTLANEILNKIKFAKNYETPSHEVAQSVVTHEGTLVPGAVKIPENFFQAPATHLTPNTTGHEETFIPKDGWMFGPKGAPATHGIAETLTPRQLAIEHSFQELGKTYTVKAGDNVWNIIKEKLVGDGKTEFAKLDTRNQNFILDSIKDRVVKMSPTELREIGIKGDPSRIYPGDELRLGKVFNSSEDLLKVFNKATGANTPSHQIDTTTEIRHVLPTPKEPIRLAQNNDIATDITPPMQPNALPPVHEIIAPVGGHLEAFSVRIQDIPAYAEYKGLVYNEIHLQHPEIGLPLYDMSMRDFLSHNPNGLEELKRVFHMDVETPKILPRETLNGSVLDYWTRQVVQHDLNKGLLAHHANTPMEPIHQNMPPHGDQTVRNIQESMARTNEKIYRDAVETKMRENQDMQETWMNSPAPGNPWMVPQQQIPPQYHQWVQRGMTQQYPNMNEEMRRQMYDQRVVDMMARDGYNQTADSVNRMSQLFGVRTPVQLTHMHSNDTPVDLMARMAWQSAQSSGHLPPNFPNPYSVIGTVGRFMSPNPTDHNIGVDDIAYKVNQTVGDAFTNGRIHSSGVTHK